MYAPQNSHRFSSDANGRAANAYARADVTARLHTASPHQLIAMLFDGALAVIGSAEACITIGRIDEKNRNASKALRIIEEGLRASLDRSGGGSLALRLDSLYDYMIRRLLTASVKNDRDGFAEVGRLLNGLRQAWEQISPENDDGASVDGTNDRRAATSPIPQHGFN